MYTITIPKVYEQNITVEFEEVTKNDSIETRRTFKYSGPLGIEVDTEDDSTIALTFSNLIYDGLCQNEDLE